MLERARVPHAATALAAAALFGAATPAAKRLLGGTEPLVLAGLLYLGSGLALGPVAFARRSSVAALSARERACLAAAIAAGGILGPAALVFGLARTSASAASLMLSFEAALTALVAAWWFREHLGQRVLLALALLTAGAVFAGSAKPSGADAVGLVLVGAACFAWAVDNNLTREVAQADAAVIVALKGLIAGATNLGLGLAFATPGGVPDLGIVAGALAIGAAGYGMSLVLYIRSLRGLGVSRTAGYFATAPFLGALLSLVWLGEPAAPGFLAAAVLMAAGTAILLSERHEHDHRHASITHEHAHVHDQHHVHVHAEDSGSAAHRHPHRHEELVHRHAHAPDLHHRHEH